MSDYIKREDALKIINDMTENEDDYCRCTNMINELPSADVVEVIRCKDCKYGEVDNADFPNQYLCNHHGSIWNEGDHYCSYGERAET